MDIKEALRKAHAWLEIQGVEGVAQGASQGRPCITVFISDEQVIDKLPKTVGGFEVVIEETEGFVSF